MLRVDRAGRYLDVLEMFALLIPWLKPLSILPMYLIFMAECSRETTVWVYQEIFVSRGGSRGLDLMRYDGEYD